MTDFEPIRRIVEEGPPLRLAVAFGSRARRTERTASDLDLAILPVDAELAVTEEHGLAGRISASLGVEVDVVRLDRAPTLLRWFVARDGQLILARQPEEWTRFRAEAASEHADFADAMVSTAELFRRRLARSAGLAAEPIVPKKLAMLREHLTRLHRRRPATRSELEANVDLQDAVALNFLVAMQEANDIAMHMSADEGWGVPGSYAEAFELLARNGVLSRTRASTCWHGGRSQSHRAWLRDARCRSVLG